MTEKLTATQISNKININIAFIRFYEKQPSNPFAKMLIKRKQKRVKELSKMYKDSVFKK